MINTKKTFMAVFMVLAMLAVAVVPLTESQSDGAVGTGGSLYGMGQNNYGQQGDGTTTDVTTPTQIGSTLGTITDVVCSNGATFFLTSDGKLYGIGVNRQYQQGDGTNTDVTTPTQIGSSLGVITDVACSDSTTFFLTSDGKLYGMGYNDQGQQGNDNGAFVKTPTQIGSTLGTITDVVCSAQTTFFLTSDGKLYGMGYNYSGQQGDGTTTDVKTPTQIGSTLGTITDVVCSNGATFFLTSDGKLYGIGVNRQYQQGDGTNTDVTTPTQIGSSLGVITDVACSDSTTFFLTSDGKLYGMGYNDQGQQGNDNGAFVKTPTQIGSTLGTITDVVCSQQTTFFLTSDGKLYGMGKNNYGQQGDGTTTDVKTPTQIGSSLGVIADVACSNNTTFFLTSGGSLYGMGQNNYGQQGDGTTTDVTTPTQIGSSVGVIADVACSNNTTFFFTPHGPTITISVNEPTYGSVSTNSVTAPSGTSISANGNVLTIGTDTVTATPSTATAQYTYAFGSWTGIPVGGTITGDTAITATFTATVKDYNVTIESNNTSYGTVSPASISDVPYGTTITVSDNTLTINGTTVTATPKSETSVKEYSFVGWKLNGTDISGTATTTDTNVITAVFEEGTKTYTITWVIDGVSEQTTVEAGAMPTHATPVKEYYTFKGWEPKVVRAVADATYTATFVPTKYTVTWNANGGTVRPTSSTGDVETAVTVPTPTRNYYTFDGWYTAAEGGDALVTPFMPNTNVTYYAHWTEETYTVSFDVQGGTAVSPMDGSVSTAISLPSATYDEKYFAGWYTAATNGKLVGFNNTLYYPKADVTLYAVWSDTAVFTYSLNFDVNGGYNAPSAQVATGNDNVPHTFKIAGSNPQMTGLYFIGWASTSSATEPEYMAGDVIEVNANNTVTLYAVWSDVEPEGQFDWLSGVVAVLVGIGILMGAVVSLVLARPTNGKDLATSIVAIAVAILLYVAVLLPFLGFL